MVIYGYQYAGALLAGRCACDVSALGGPTPSPFYILAVFCLNFFRDPERHGARRSGGCFARRRQGCRRGSRALAARTASAIFLNVFDVHVNRYAHRRQGVLRHV